MSRILPTVIGIGRKSIVPIISSNALIAGCTVVPAPVPQDLLEDFPKGPPLPEVQQLLDKQAMLQQQRLVLLLDNSGSFKAHHTASVTSADIQRLADVMIASGRRNLL